MSSDEVIDRLRDKLRNEPGARLFMMKQTDVRIGGRQSMASFDYTLQSDGVEELRAWEPRIRQVMSELPELEDVNSDVQDYGVQTSLVIDRDAIKRLGLSMAQIDATLYDAFGQRQVSTIYGQANQYRVILEAQPRYQTDPASLSKIYVTGNITSTGTTATVGNTATGTLNTNTSATPNAVTGSSQVPLSAFARFEHTAAPLAIAHQEQFPAATISFNLAPWAALSDAVAALASGVVILYTGWTPIDPMLTMLICGLILFSTLSLLRRVVNTLLEAVPDGISLPEVGRAMAAVHGVRSVHDLHIWSLDSHRTALSAHVVLGEAARWPAVLEAERKLLQTRFGIEHATLQPELPPAQPLVFTPRGAGRP